MKDIRLGDEPNLLSDGIVRIVMEESAAMMRTEGWGKLRGGTGMGRLWILDREWRRTKMSFEDCFCEI